MVAEMEDTNPIENLVVKVEVDPFPTDMDYNPDINIKTEPPEEQAYSLEELKQEFTEMPEPELEMKIEIADTQDCPSEDDFIVPDKSTELLNSSDSRGLTQFEGNGEQQLSVFDAKVESSDWLPQVKEEQWDSCTVGKTLLSPCHERLYLKRRGLVFCVNLTPEEQFLITNRTGVNCATDAVICFHHKAKFLKKFPFLQRTCCDPFSLHSGKVVRKGLRVITIQRMERVLKKMNVRLICGKKLCVTCVKKSITAVENSSQTPIFGIPVQDVLKVGPSIYSSDTGPSTSVSGPSASEAGLSITDTTLYHEELLSTEESPIIICASFSDALCTSKTCSET